MVFLDRQMMFILFTLLMICQCPGLPPNHAPDGESTSWGNNNIVVPDCGVRKIVEGTVCSLDEGSPVGGALVEVYLDESAEGRKWEYSEKRVAVCKTKSNGRFKFDSLPVGKYEVRCSLNGYQTVSFAHVTIVSGKKPLNKEQFRVFLYACD